MSNEGSEQTHTSSGVTKVQAKPIKPWYKKKRIILPLILFVFIPLVATSDDSEDSNSSISNESLTSLEKQNINNTSTSEADETSNLTASQENAIRSAKSYISLSGFSREGLIDQLSSEYGDQYTVEDATVAVDSLEIDYNEQAKRSAESYLEMSGFSCQGLIDQLSSEAGDKYTADQARSGAEAAGAC